MRLGVGLPKCGVGSQNRKWQIHVEWVTCVYIHTTNFVLIILLGAHTEERVRECILVCTWTHMSGLGGSMTAHNI